MTTLLDQRGITQSRLARETSLSLSSVNGWLQNDATATIDALPKLCQYLGVSADFLLGLSDVSCPDSDLQTLSRRTGLSEAAIVALCDHHDSYQKHPAGLKDEPVGLLDRLLADPAIWGILDQLLIYVALKNSPAAVPELLELLPFGSDQFVVTLKNLEALGYTIMERSTAARLRLLEAEEALKKILDSIPQDEVDGLLNPRTAENYSHFFPIIF